VDRTSGWREVVAIDCYQPAVLLRPSERLVVDKGSKTAPFPIRMAPQNESPQTRAQLSPQHTDILDMLRRATSLHDGGAVESPASAGERDVSRDSAAAPQLPGPDDVYVLRSSALRFVVGWRTYRDDMGLGVLVMLGWRRVVQPAIGRVDNGSTKP
jgi:hypothetical protein